MTGMSLAANKLTSLEETESLYPWESRSLNTKRSKLSSGSELLSLRFLSGHILCVIFLYSGSECATSYKAAFDHLEDNWGRLLSGLLSVTSSIIKLHLNNFK